MNMHQDVRLDRCMTAVRVYEEEGKFRVVRMIKTQRGLGWKRPAKAWVLHISISLGLVKNECKRQHAKRSLTASLHIPSQWQFMTESIETNKPAPFAPNVPQHKTLQSVDGFASRLISRRIGVMAHVRKRGVTHGEPGALSVPSYALSIRIFAQFHRRDNGDGGMLRLVGEGCSQGRLGWP